MAPPANRRPGNSRRAQYSTFIGYIAGAVGAVIGAALLIISIYDPAAFAALRGLASDAVEPAGRLSASTRSASASAYDTVNAYFRAGRQNTALQRELRAAKVKLAEAQDQRAENRRLKALLGLTKNEPDYLLVTKLTASTTTSTRRMATLGAGRDRGVQVGMPVRSQDGLVGRVLEVSITTSRVLLVSDSGSLVPVRRARDGLAGFAQGTGDGALQIRLIDLASNPLRKGDVFVTSGTGGLYQPGTALAVVTARTRDGAIARVLSDPAATDYVMVERSWAPPPVPQSGSPDPAAPASTELP